MKNNFRYFYLPLLLFGVLIMNSCIDKTAVTPVETLPFYLISDEFKSYCLFQPGSNWDYYYSDIDTNANVVVSEVVENKWLNEFGENYNYQAFDMTLMPNDLGISMIEITAGSSLNAVNNMNSLMWIFFSNGDYRLVFDAKYPMGEEQILGEHEGVYENVETLPSLFVKEKEYLDVYHTSVKDHFEQGFGDYDFYIAKNHGLIKLINIVNGDTTLIEMANSQVVQ